MFSVFSRFRQFPRFHCFRLFFSFSRVCQKHKERPVIWKPWLTPVECSELLRPHENTRNTAPSGHGEPAPYNNVLHVHRGVVGGYPEVSGWYGGYRVGTSYQGCVFGIWAVPGWPWMARLVFWLGGLAGVWPEGCQAGLMSGQSQARPESGQVRPESGRPVASIAWSQYILEQYRAYSQYRAWSQY